jgi:hypothetical protein
LFLISAFSFSGFQIFVFNSRLADAVIGVPGGGFFRRAGRPPLPPRHAAISSLKFKPDTAFLFAVWKITGIMRPSK